MDEGAAFQSFGCRLGPSKARFGLTWVMFAFLSKLLPILLIHRGFNAILDFQTERSQ